MKAVSSVIFLSAFLATLSGCNPFAPDQSVILGVSELKAPATVSAGSPLDVVMTVTLGGCLSFDHIQAERSESGGTLTVWGKDSSKGRKNVACPQNIIPEDHSFRFEPPFGGTFSVTVNRGRLSPLIATVQVQ